MPKVTKVPLLVFGYSILMSNCPSFFVYTGRLEEHGDDKAIHWGAMSCVSSWHHVPVQKIYTPDICALPDPQNTGK